MLWSPQQSGALGTARSWIRNPHQQILYIGGFAGVGKTTLAQELTRSAQGRWLYGAYTGKAAHVLRQKGCDASTIHSIIYRPNGESKTDDLRVLEAKLSVLYANIGDRFPNALTEIENKELDRLLKLQKQLESKSQPRFAIWPESPLADMSVEGIVIDECSMVDEQMGRDLESFEKKILVLGDPAQLPPVGAGGYFTKREPDVMLTEVHRHAKDSGILRLATLIREGWDIRHLITEEWGKDVELSFRQDLSTEDLWMWMLGADQVLVGKNDTRRRANEKHRKMINMYEPGPMPDDRLICLKNRYSEGLFNGSQWKVLDANSDFENGTADLKLVSEDGAVDGEICVGAWLHHMIGKSDELKEMGEAKRAFAEFDWSYAITVHKAQGSQWDDVVLIDESRSFRADFRKWLYTGITRAAKTLKVVL